jgi:hypothetical protein
VRKDRVYREALAPPVVERPVRPEIPRLVDGRVLEHGEEGIPVIEVRHDVARDARRVDVVGVELLLDQDGVCLFPQAPVRLEVVDEFSKDVCPP